MQLNNYKCTLCSEIQYDYYCKFRCCEVYYCFPCIFKWLQDNFICNIHSEPVTGFVIYNIYNNQILYSDNSFKTFENWKANMMLDLSIMNQEYFHTILNIQPANFSLIFRDGSHINFDNAMYHFDNYGFVDKMTGDQNGYTVYFYNIHNIKQMLNDLASHMSIEQNL